MQIDWWTLALQTINVLVLVWILARFFFRPVSDIVAKRQEEAKKLLADAAAARQHAADARADVDKMLAGIEAQRERLLAEARKSAEIEKANQLAQAAQEIAKLHSEARAAIDRDRSAANTAVIERASELAVVVAEQLVGRFPPMVAFDAFLGELCNQIRKLSSQVRSGLISSAIEEQTLDVVTATPLSESAAEHVRSALEEAFGTRLSVAFRSDRTLLAGIELHGRNAILRNSWRADLNRIREELSRDKHGR